MKKIFLCLIAFVGIMPQSFTQSIFYVKTGTPHVILSNTIVSLNNLSLTPSTDISFEGNSVYLYTTNNDNNPIRYGSNPYRFGKTLKDFKGSVQIKYNSEFASSLVSEFNIALLGYDSILWNSYKPKIRDTYSKYVQTDLTNAVSFNELQLADVTTWSGKSDGNWSIDSNWTNGVPTNNINVFINTPYCKLDSDYTVGNNKVLNIAGTGKLNVNPGKTLSIDNGGIANFGSNPVTFRSDATQTAQLGQVLGVLSNATNVTMERYMPAKRAFRLVSSPVTTSTSIKQNWMENGNYTAGFGTHITGNLGAINGFDATISNNPSMFIFDKNYQNWVASYSTSNLLNSGDAYRLMVRGDRSINLNSNTSSPTNTILRITGTPKVGNYTVTGSTIKYGLTLVGNPYQSTVDMVSVIANSTNVRNNYSIWDPNQGTRGVYVTYDLNLLTANIPGSVVNQFLQPGQASFIQTDNVGSSIILFQESNKSNPSKQSSTFQSAVVYPMLNVSLNYTDSLANDAPAMDGFKVAFGSSFNNAVDNNDAQKLTNLDENMSIIRDANYLSIEKRNLYDATTEIPMSFSNYIRQQYTLRFSWSNPSDNSFVAQLQDSYTNTLTPINFSGNSDYSYTIDNNIAASKAFDRFKIVFVPNAALPVSGLTLTGTSKGNAVVLQFEALNEKDMHSYAIERSADATLFTKLGEQQPLNGTSASSRYYFTDNNPLTGINYYRIKGTSINGHLQYSNVVGVKTGSMLPTVTVAPNPVANKVLNLKLSQLTKGSYKMTVTDVAGRMIFIKEMVYDGVSSALKITLPSTLKPGNYYVRLSGNGTDFTEKFFVQ